MLGAGCETRGGVAKGRADVLQDVLIKVLAVALVAWAAVRIFGAVLTGQSVKRDGSSREAGR